MKIHLAVGSCRQRAEDALLCPVRVGGRTSRESFSSYNPPSAGGWVSVGMRSPNSAGAAAGGGRSLAGAFAAMGWKNVGFISICGHNIIAHFHILPLRRSSKSIVDLSHSFTP